MRRGALALLLCILAISTCVAAHAADDGTPKGIEVIGAERPASLDRLVGVMQELGLRLPPSTRVYIYSSRQAFRR